MVADWVEQGLLDRPRPRPAAANGTEPRVFPPSQRDLFTRLLAARERPVPGRVGQRSLVRVVLYVWLIDDDVVPFAQARRALRTYARSAGRLTAVRSRETARAVVEELAHPSAGARQRRAAQVAVEECERTGRLDRERLTSVLTDLCSPWPAGPGAPKVERARSGPFGPASVQHYLARWQATRRTIGHLRQAETDEATLDRARMAYRRNWADYQASRAAWAAGDGALAGCFADLATVEGRATDAVNAFVDRLADELGLLTAGTPAADAIGSRRAYRQVS
ncbi:hypothetical protein WN71_031775 [Streptomyces mangrovisoli]|uniref:Uncharacterized protein n=2 Tax=Streptomyces mangrovisoli TaxID=1428628 RepID=A0A1J4NRU7_9ACTN|nr:hypothetical protein WN71_031775 [Streptomyces mangrovisoli]